MGRFENSIEIKAPPEKVWEMLALDRFPEYVEDIKSVEYTSEVNTPKDKYRVGATVHIIEKHEEFDMEITESIENEKITCRSKGPFSQSGNVTLIISHTLKPTKTGTEITYAGEYEMPYGIFGKLLDKLFMQRVSEKQTEKSLEKLKSIVEK